MKKYLRNRYKRVSHKTVCSGYLRAKIDDFRGFTFTCVFFINESGWAFYQTQWYVICIIYTFPLKGPLQVIVLFREKYFLISIFQTENIRDCKKDHASNKAI